MMADYIPISAAFARSLVRGSWSEPMRKVYDRVFSELEKDIESAAKRGCTGYVFGAAEDESPEVIVIVAEELREAGFIVTKSSDFKDELVILWAQE